MIRKLRFGGSVRPRTAKLGKLKTSFRLEDEFWTALIEIAFVRGISISKLVADINKRGNVPVTVEIRRQASIASGH